MKTILVAIDGSPISDDIVHLASKLAKLEKAKMFIVYVFEVPRALPLEAEIPDELEKGDKILNHAAGIAEEYNLEPETDIVQARSAGPGIVEEAKDLQVDLIIIGMSNKPRIGELFFGSTVNYILKKSSCQVIVLRQTME